MLRVSLGEVLVPWIVNQTREKYEGVGFSCDPVILTLDLAWVSPGSPVETQARPENLHL